ncbi:lipase [Nocardia puris]|uniref:lipase family protein n=1 Tax=Nocardia puris TaxID=208602 RepID=UPI0018939FF0|nr:lipase family protein [Nocardia puris]MBF6364719.1 lipase [Nocardia puris]
MSVDIAAEPLPLTDPDRPLVLEDDPFYRVSGDLAHHLPGTALRTRRVEIALFGILPQRVSAWQLLYRTCDLHGVPEAAVTTVLLPWDADPTVARPLLSFQCAIDGVSSRCFPSYALRRGARALGAIPQVELPVIASALTRGWAVSVPDHGGMAGQFGVAREPGYRALDGVRAALNCTALGLPSDTAVGLWGYSGGGLATAWAAELAAEYAPELNIVGAVAGSPVGDPGSAFVRLNGTLLAGFATVCVAALRRAYPALNHVLREHVHPEFLDMLAATESLTTFELLPRLARKNIDDFSTTTFADLLARPEMRDILDDIRPGVRAPAMPVLVVQGVNDELIAVADVDAHVDRYRRAGAHVRYVRDRLSLHLPLLFLSAPLTMNWMADRFAHRDPGPAGTSTVWSVALGRREVRAHLGFAQLLGRMVLSRPLFGPRTPEATRVRQRTVA